MNRNDRLWSSIHHVSWGFFSVCCPKNSKTGAPSQLWIKESSSFKSNHKNLCFQWFPLISQVWQKYFGNQVVKWCCRYWVIRRKGSEESGWEFSEDLRKCRCKCWLQGPARYWANKKTGIQWKSAHDVFQKNFESIKSSNKIFLKRQGLTLEFSFLMKCHSPIKSLCLRFLSNRFVKFDNFIKEVKIGKKWEHTCFCWWMIEYSAQTKKGKTTKTSKRCKFIKWFLLWIKKMIKIQRKWKKKEFS